LSYFIFSTHWAKFADGTKVQEIKRNILLLGEDKKCYERQEHTSCSEGGKEAGISMDLSLGTNKSKYKNGKKTAV